MKTKCSHDQRIFSVFLKNLSSEYIVSCYMTFWDMTIYNGTPNWSDISPICELITELDLSTDFDLVTNFRDRALQRVRLANRGRLLLQTPGPVPFVTCICFNVDFWPCHVFGLWISNIPRYFYFALQLLQLWLRVQSFLATPSIFASSSFSLLLWSPKKGCTVFHILHSSNLV